MGFKDKLATGATVVSLAALGAGTEDCSAIEMGQRIANGDKVTDVLTHKKSAPGADNLFSEIKKGESPNKYTPELTKDVEGYRDFADNSGTLPGNLADLNRYGNTVKSATITGGDLADLFGKDQAGLKGLIKYAIANGTDKEPVKITLRVDSDLLDADAYAAKYQASGTGKDEAARTAALKAEVAPIAEYLTNGSVRKAVVGELRAAATDKTSSDSIFGARADKLLKTFVIEGVKTSAPLPTTWEIQADSKHDATFLALAKNLTNAERSAGAPAYELTAQPQAGELAEKGHPRVQEILAATALANSLPSVELTRGQTR